MKSMIDLKTCPTCGSAKIRKVRRTVTRGPVGRRYTVPQLTFHECPACGEQVYGPEAMQKIQSRRESARMAQDATTS
jgi:YgiT-type zinc finger domain-containing protein